MNIKFCNTCGTEKSISLFYNNKSAKDNLQNKCKDCANKANKKQNEKNKLKNKNNITKIKKIICSKCKINKNICEFYKKSNSGTGFNPQCKLCRILYYKKLREKNKEKFLKKEKLLREKRIIWLNNLKKDKPCIDCGKIYEPYCMDYDHLNSENKIDCVTKMVMNNVSKNIILQEIKKCELVCCICHTIRTNKRINEKNKNKKYTNRILKNIEMINEAKNKPCEICGIKFQSFSMCFDHLYPMMKFKQVSSMTSYSKESILKEIEKCRVLCILCHRRISTIEQQNNKYPNNQKNINNRKIKIKRAPFIDVVKSIKECNVCHKRLPFDNFKKCDRSRSNLQNTCITCRDKKTQ